MRDMATPSPATKDSVPTPDVPSRLRGLRRGNPGNKGGGRQSENFRQWCRDTLGRKPTRAEVEAIAKDKSHPQFMACLKWLAENGHGKPTEHHEYSGPDGSPIQFVVVGGKKVGF